MEIHLHAPKFTNDGEQEQNDTYQYYLKVLQEADDESTTGLHSCGGTLEDGCGHMIGIINQMSQCMSSAEMRYVVVPRGLRAADSDTQGKDVIIFDNLSWKDIAGGLFKYGLPNRFAKNGEHLWQSCLKGYATNYNKRLFFKTMPKGCKLKNEAGLDMSPKVLKCKAEKCGRDAAFDNYYRMYYHYNLK